jgi:cytochrome c553
LTRRPRRPLARAAIAAALSGGLCAAALAAGDPQAGAAKAETCLGCHDAGKAQAATVPSLAGQPAYYLALQLVFFRDKQRDIPEMTPFAADLTDRDIEDLAAFFAARRVEPEEQGPADPARMARGAALAEAHHCGACHLPDYSGRQQMPRLAGQREDYLLKALADYRTGRRAGYDGTMTGVLYGMSEAQLADLAHFLAHQR